MFDLIQQNLVTLKKDKFHRHVNELAMKPIKPSYYNHLDANTKHHIFDMDINNHSKETIMDHYESLDERVLTCTDGFYYFGMAFPTSMSKIKSNLELYSSYENSRKISQYSEIIKHRGTIADTVMGLVFTGLIVCKKSQPDQLHINIENMAQTTSNFNHLIIHVQNPKQTINIEYKRREQECKFVKITLLIDAGCDVTVNEVILGNSQISFDTVCGEYASLRHHIQQSPDSYSHYVSNVDLNTGSDVQIKHITWAKHNNSINLFNNVYHSHKGVYDFTSRTIAQDMSKVHVEGLINVTRQNTDSSTDWNHKGLILDEMSSISGSPQLNIKTKEVTATHGFAVSEPSKELLNYLESRGMSQHRALQNVCLGHISI